MRHILASVPLLSAAPLPAADAPAEAIVVTATRTEATLGQLAQSVSLLDAPRLATLQSATVVDALAFVPGVQFVRQGGPGSLASVFVRGAERDQVLAVIDGVRINDPASPGGGFDFGPLLLGNIQSIEVVRGSQSVLWGSQAIGGIIHMIAMPPAERLTVTARAEGGFRNTAQGFANVSGRSGALAATLGGGYFRTDGISAFSEARGGVERDGHEGWGLNGRLEVEVTPALALDLRGFWSASTTDIDGFPPPRFQLADTLEQSISRQFAGYAGARLALLQGRVRARAAGTFSSVDRENRDPAFGPSPLFASLGTNERFEAQAVADAAPWLELTAGYEHETSRFRTQGAGAGAAPARARAGVHSGYGQATARPAQGLMLQAGARHDAHSEFGGSWVASTGGSYTPDAGRTVLRASYGEGFKVPSLFQLYSDFGNAVLVPERSASIDAGLTRALVEGFTLSVTGFRRLARDQILFVSCFGNSSLICLGRPFGTYDNVGRTRVQGLELEAVLRPTDALELRAGYTLLEAVDRTTRRALARRPRDQLFATLDTRPGAGVALGGSLRLVGDSFDDAANRRRLAGHVVADLRAAVGLGGGWALQGRVENLFDERYETAFPYGTPGRAAYVGLRWGR